MQSRIVKLLKDPSKIFLTLGNRGFFRYIKDEDYLKIAFKIKLKKKLDLENPRSFNEKLQWLKLYYRGDKYTTIVDKYAAKQYVADLIGDQYIIPTYGVWETFDDINFAQLPSQFVLKCTHNSGGVVVCKNKDDLDISKAKNILNKCLKKNYYWGCREYPYKNVKPRIIAECYLEDEKQGEIRDYKFFCFDGEVKFFKIDFDRFTNHHANYYSAYDNSLLPFGELDYYPIPDKKIEMPKKLEEMKRIAAVLSDGFPFIRVDLYEVNNKVYFGELTLFPASGLGVIIPDGYDEKLGDMIKLP